MFTPPFKCGSLKVPNLVRPLTGQQTSALEYLDGINEHCTPLDLDMNKFDSGNFALILLSK
jgi:hypothetical protein